MLTHTQESCNINSSSYLLNHLAYFFYEVETTENEYNVNTNSLHCIELQEKSTFS